MKYLIYILLSIFLFSCNGISDEEMEIRLAELELVNILNTNIQDEILELNEIIYGKMVLPSNKEKIRPLFDKRNTLDSLVSDFKNYINSHRDYKQINLEVYTNKSDLLHQSIIEIIGSDSTNGIKIYELLFDNAEFEYPFSMFKDEVDTLHQHQLTFIGDIKSISTEIERKELNSYTLTYILLLQKKTLKYLQQKYNFIGGIISNEYDIILDLKKVNVNPNQNLEFSIFPSLIYSNNLTNTKAVFNNDSTIFDSYKYGNLYIDTIWLPTHTIGSHHIHIKQYWFNNSFRESEFNYQVIEHE